MTVSRRLALGLALAGLAAGPALAQQFPIAGKPVTIIGGFPNGAGTDIYSRKVAEPLSRALGVPVMADISTLEEGVAAAEMGADLVATTMSGYTPYTQHRRTMGADIALVGQLAQKVTVPVICEGRISSPEEARLALEAGAWAVVVGTAITAIDQVTARFVERMRQRTAGNGNEHNS